MNTDEELRDRLFAIWDKASIPGDGRVPLIPHAPRQGCVLFVGMNPSASERGFAQVLKALGRDLDPALALRWDQRKSFDLKLWMEVERSALETYSYFGAFRKFKKATGVEWDHIDLFQYRDTNQKRVISKLFAAMKPELVLTTFGRAQLDLSREMIEASRPAALVVVNAMGSRVLWETLRPEFDLEAGCYRLSIAGRATPVFFTSMLTQQRALDVFSRTRLFWHICNVLGVAVKAEEFVELDRSGRGEISRSSVTASILDDEEN